MLWISDSTGRIALIGQQWWERDEDRDPGSFEAESIALDDDVVHSDDLSRIRRLLSSKNDQLSGTFRVRRGLSGTYVQVHFDATQAVSPSDGSFLGYIGTAEIQTDQGDSALRPFRSVDSFSTAYLTEITNLFQTARLIATKANDFHLIKIIDFALTLVSDHASKRSTS